MAFLFVVNIVYHVSLYMHIDYLRHFYFVSLAEIVKRRFAVSLFFSSSPRD